MYCRSCGKELSSEDKFCPNCGLDIQKNVDYNNSNVDNGNVTDNHITSNVADTNENINDDRNCNIICGISLFMFFGASSILLPLFGNSEKLSNIFGIAPLIGIVLMIIARVKYPNKTFPKVLMWLYIAMVIIWIILLIVFLVACASCMDTVVNTDWPDFLQGCASVG